MAVDYRIEKDSLGDVRVPRGAMYGAQTQRAVDNFPISGQRFSRRFIQAVGLIKAHGRVTRSRGPLVRWRRGNGMITSWWTSTRQGLVPRPT